METTVRTLKKNLDRVAFLHFQVLGSLVIGDTLTIEKQTTS